MVKYPRKGAILAGGQGTRLRPHTYRINKHLLPVYDRLMIDFPLDLLVRMGISEVCIVTGEKDLADFERFLGDGSALKINITYRTQKGAEGLADAVLKTKHFFGKEKAIVVLGDDIFERVKIPAGAFDDDYAYVAVTEAKGIGINAKAVGIPEMRQDGTILRIEEKPDNPKSNLMAAGFYIYPPDVFDSILEQKPSSRGEMEITDVNNWYANRGRLRSLNEVEFIADMGSLKSLLEASEWRARQIGVM